LDDAVVLVVRRDDLILGGGGGGFRGELRVDVANGVDQLELDPAADGRLRRESEVDVKASIAAASDSVLKLELEVEEVADGVLLKLDVGGGEIG
jgi:hypothetical protein